MRQGLQLRLSQHLALTPQLQQSIRLLQLSTLELNAEIDQALQDNPLLERDEPGEPVFNPGAEPATTAQSATPAEPEERQEARGGDDEGWGMDFSGSHGQRDPNDDDLDSGESQAASTSLREHLGTQLAMTQLPDRERALVSFLIEALNDDGYLTQPLDELVSLLVNDDDEMRETLLDELGIALCHLQNFDPPGIAARSAQECLTLQLKTLPDSAERAHALTVVGEHLDHLAARDFARIKKALGCDDDELRAAQRLILSLNPRPGAQYAAIDTRYVVPDVAVRKVHDQWLASLNREAMPRLRINRLYADILNRHRGGNGSSSGLASQLQEAKWLIKNVQQRFDTILRVSQAIVDRQRAFFDHGEVAMRPLTLREIAETVQLHESTISRVTTQKYLASPRGIFELKYFFGSHVATDTGGAASSTAIRALIKQLVGAEDGKKPLSDSRLADILGEQGIVVARRTVAKYRELLGIPPVNLRKVL
ncbi:MAG: RNA polymerase factor sigma-54 [Burkholderiaceae bacterium]|nr:RNA polymerase factor sigma-54 [Sulfuritalea sp.]MCF8176028.1 RNA polymerase factor sigma-54 [Burkholderiaceae bacterium]MCF8184895.1 RNA polymerase factor sigma-54 [Polynucleobacter sp.]